ncbi:MAG: tetratricopeptide repeat protein [Planctomycetota bacterium]
MRFASSTVIALAPLGFLAWVCASHVTSNAPAAVNDARSTAGDSGSAESAGKPQIQLVLQDAPTAADLSHERHLVEEARAAATRADLVTSRAKASEAIELLLARPQRDRGTGWIELLGNAGRTASEARDTNAARVAFEEVLEVYSLSLPDDHPDIQAARHDLSLTLCALREFAGARALMQKILESRSRTLPDEHPDVQWARGNLAFTLRMLGELTAARELEEKVLEVRSRTLPDDHPDLQMARGNLANTLKALGDLAAARALLEKVLEVRSRTLPDEHPQMQAARADLALTLFMLGDLAATRTLQERVLEIHSRTLPEGHPELQYARANFANTLFMLGEISAARTLQEKVLEVLSRSLPDDHPDLQGTRNNLASTLYKLGHVAEARALQERVFEIRSRELPDDHPDLQVTRQNLALTLYTLGDLGAARALQEKVLEVHSHSLRDDHPNLQAARHNLACTLYTLGDFAAARALQEKALDVFSRSLPEDHPDLQTARINLANLLRTLGDFQAARTLEERVLEVRSRSLPDDHPDLQVAREGLANTLHALDEFAAARLLREDVLQARLRSLPDDHPDLQNARLNLAFTIADGHAAGTGEEGGREKFAQVASSFIRAMTRSARTAVLTASSREAEERCANCLPNLSLALSYADGMNAFENDLQLEREAFVLSEETRGGALASAHMSRRASSDPLYGKLRKKMRAASDELARLAQQGADADEIDRARTARESAERELSRLALELLGEADLLGFDSASLSATLSEREALVGFRRYTSWKYEPGRRTAPKSIESLCAFVLRSGDRLERVEIGPIEPIERAVERWREAIGVRLDRGVALTQGRDEVLLRGRELRALLFDPLRRTLEESDQIVAALDDVLHLVPLDALPLEEAEGMPAAAAGSLVGDRWRIETRSALSELSWSASPLPHGETLLALGGASFNLAPLPFGAEPNTSLETKRTEPTEESSGVAPERTFVPLPHSGPEAHGIAELYSEAFDDRRPALVLEKRKASRAALVELAPKARFLHIATHGWFAPESVRSIVDPEPLDKLMGFGSRMSGEERARGMSPMLLCGLALAGANLAEDELGRAPGLITAEEISTFDLAGCELAVLSACDTNVGERRAGQGVASLQKALHMAGARTVITSLWKVPDEATRELMLDFYRRIWIEKKPKGVALWEAKTRIRDAKDERGKLLYSIRDWAAWVLTGDPN